MMLGFAASVTALTFIACSLIALPPRRWALFFEKAAICLAGLTCGSHLLLAEWLGAGVWFALGVAAVFTLQLKREALRLRESRQVNR